MSAVCRIFGVPLDIKEVTDRDERNMSDTSRHTSRNMPGGYIPRISVSLMLAACMVFLISSVGAAQTEDVVLEGEVLDQVKSLQERASDVQADLEKLDIELEMTVEEHNATRDLLDQLTMDLADSRARLDDIIAQYNAQSELMSQRMVAIYKADEVNMFTILLTSSSFSDVYDSARYMMKISEQDAKLEAQLRESSNEISELTDQIDNDRADQMRYEKDLQEQEKEIKVKIAQREEAYDQLDAEIRSIIEQEAARQQAERERAAAEMAAMLEDLEVSDSVQAQVVQTALQYLGVPYVWGGESPRGFDCSGLTKYVYAQHGVNLPHNAAMQFNLDMGVPVSNDQLQPGDLVFWGPGYPHHVGMYIGKGNYIEAPNFGEVVSISSLSFGGDYAGARRFPLKAWNS